LEYIKKKEQYDLVYAKGRITGGSLLYIKTMPNGLNFSRHGFIVNKRIGKAVIRNKLRRRLREIMRQAALKAGWDVVIYTRPAAAAAGYKEIKNMILSLLIKAQLLTEKYEKTCPGAD
jgi:ribonuclease P protein component